MRTLDLVTYELTIGNSGLGNDINQTTITSTLPVGMVWAALDATCRVSGAIPVPVPASTISADRRSIVCNIGSRLAGSLVRTSLQAYPQATVPDGTTKTTTFGLDYNDPGSANARLSASGGSASVLVSAGKPFDLSHNHNVNPVFGLQYTTSTALVATSSPVSGTVTNGASPLSGAVVALYDSSNNPKIDPTTSLPYQTTTDGSGNYSFASVTNGVTRIKVISGVPSGDVPSATMSYLVTIQGQAIHANFDYVTPTLGTTTGTISGTLFNDTNVDGVLGAESAVDLVGLTLTGFDSTGNPVTRTTTTDASGAYSFSVPPSGANGYKIVTTGRKVAFYLAVLTSEETIFVGDGETGQVPGRVRLHRPERGHRPLGRESHRREPADEDQQHTDRRPAVGRSPARNSRSSPSGASRSWAAGSSSCRRLAAVAAARSDPNAPKHGYPSITRASVESHA